MIKNLFKKKPKVFKHHIEVCISNEAYGHPDFIDRLLEHDFLEVEEVGCNSYCEVCECGPYALVNNEVVTATTEQQLYENVIALTK